MLNATTYLNTDLPCLTCLNTDLPCLMCSKSDVCNKKEEMKSIYSKFSNKNNGEWYSITIACKHFLGQSPNYK